MKKQTFYFILLMLLISCTSGVDNKSSKAIWGKIDTILHDNTKSDQMKIIEINNLKFDLAEAYNSENRPDDAIEELQKLIKENRNPKDFYGRPFPMTAAFYGMEAIYYKELARSYKLKNDKGSEKKALKKAENATTMENKLRPIEEAKKKKEEKKERDSILN